MSSNVPISAPDITAPTPQNTPYNPGPMALGLSRPTVPAISEDNEDNSDEPMDVADGALSGLQQHMVGMVQSKLAGLLGKSSGYIEGLPVDVKLNVEALKGVQAEYNKLQNKYRLECLELERKVCFLFCCSFFFFFFFSGNRICHFVGIRILDSISCSWAYRFFRDRPRSKALRRAFDALSHHLSFIILFIFILHSLINLPIVPRASKTTI